MLKLTLAACAVLACASAFAQSSAALDQDLQHAQLCAKAAAEFRKRPEWVDPVTPTTFTNHFNKALGKCLVKASSTIFTPGSKTVLEAEHVYDAFEGTVLGGRLTTKSLPSATGEQKIVGILMVRDGKELGKNDPAGAREAYAWFEPLMRD